MNDSQKKIIKSIVMNSLIESVCVTFIFGLLNLYFVFHLMSCPKNACKFTCVLAILFFSSIFLYYIQNLIRVTSKKVILSGTYMYLK